jgi:hypothetical protein
MLDRLQQLLGVSTAVAVVALLFLAGQVAIQVYALVDLTRREQVYGGRKWVWALIIVLGNLVGAIGYLVAGRPVPAIHVSGSGASAGGGDAARRAVDALYGPRDER